MQMEARQAAMEGTEIPAAFHLPEFASKIPKKTLDKVREASPPKLVLPTKPRIYRG
jgi:hypothetical protein